jgi:hypothetical protein
MDRLGEPIRPLASGSACPPPDPIGEEAAGLDPVGQEATGLDPIREEHDRRHLSLDPATLVPDLASPPPDPTTSAPDPASAAPAPARGGGRGGPTPP